MKDIEISTPFIKLGQFLKFANIAASGGDIKAILEDGSVKVDGALEMRRGRKLYPNSIVEIEGEGTFTVKHVSD